jgi:cytochrome c-type biogenesis protein CcmH
MRRLLPVLALLAFALAGPARAVDDPSEMLADHAQEQRAEEIGRQLRCLVCQNESIEDSSADLARDLRRIVRQRVVAGDSDRQVIDWVVKRYGTFVELKPPFNAETLLLWGAPVLALAIGAGAVVLALRQRRTTPPPPLSEAERSRLDELIGS